MVRVIVVVPTYENICPEVFKAIYDLDKGENEVDFEFIKGYDTATSRNKIAMEAMQLKYDYVLMVDNDTIIPHDTLLNMLDPQEDIVLGFCPIKNTKNKSSALIRISNPRNYIKMDELPRLPNRVELKDGGMACALIKTDVFEKLPFPWFYFEQRRDGFQASEGYYFCDKARENGFRIWGDTRVKCGHLARYFQYE